MTTSTHRTYTSEDYKRLLAASGLTETAAFQNAYGDHELAEVALTTPADMLSGADATEEMEPDYTVCNYLELLAGVST